MVKLLALLLCEKATFNRNEKVTLHGLFDGLRIPRPEKVPGSGPQTQLFFVFYKVVVTSAEITTAGVPGRISLRITNPSGEDVQGSWTDPVPFAGAFTWQSIWALTTDLFQDSGLYKLELLCSNDGSAVTVGETQLLVEHI
ncbi:MAG TPA: hypothetical protein VGZ29_08310 [Terriglobia bacterium]|nr:hypothetical protein [Terriglobia bacterium]